MIRSRRRAERGSGHTVVHQATTVAGETIAESHRRRWGLPLALGTTLLIASVLLAVHVTETDIDLDVSVSEASFTLTSEQALTTAMNVTTLGATGTRRIRLPLGLDVPKRPSNDGTSSVRLSFPPTAHDSGITVSPIVAPAGSRVSLRAGADRHHRLSITSPSGGEVIVTVSVVGPVEVGFADASRSVLDFQTPKAVIIVGGSGTLDLDLAFAPERPGAVASDLGVQDLVLARIAEIEAGHTLLNRVPTIQTGTLYLNSLNGKAVNLRAAEALQFHQSDGELRNAKMLDGTIALAFSGRVRGMTGGSTRHAVQLMPNLLEWFAANQTLALLWSTALSLFGIWLSIERWWSKAS
jgi:hypothetical protein